MSGLTYLSIEHEFLLKLFIVHKIWNTSPTRLIIKVLKALKVVCMKQGKLYQHMKETG